MRVLVVDDDKALVDLIATILEGEGYAVQTAGNGREALDCAVESAPDLIILDLRMPLMDGWTCCRLLRQNEKTAVIPVIVMSADKVQATISEELEIEHFLGKPFDADYLLACVRKCSGAPPIPIQ